MSNTTLLKCLVVTSMAVSFRRADHGFTDKGTAFALDHFDKEQLDALHKEPRLSLREVPVDSLPDTVDRAPLDAARLDALKKGKAEGEEKTPVKKATGTKTGAGGKGTGGAGTKTPSPNKGADPKDTGDSGTKE